MAKVCEWALFIIGTNCSPQQQWLNNAIRALYMPTTKTIRQAAWQLNSLHFSLITSAYTQRCTWLKKSFLVTIVHVFFFFFPFIMSLVLLGPSLSRRDHWFSFLMPCGVDMSWFLKEHDNHMLPVLRLLLLLITIFKGGISDKKAQPLIPTNGDNAWQ